MSADTYFGVTGCFSCAARAWRLHHRFSWTASRHRLSLDEVPSLAAKIREFQLHEKFSESIRYNHVQLKPGGLSAVCRNRRKKQTDGGKNSIHQTRQTKRSLFQRHHFSSIFYSYESCGRRKCPRSGAAGKPSPFNVSLRGLKRITTRMKRLACRLA